MSIEINHQTQLFHLQTDHLSDIFQVMENGELGQLYFGARVHHQKSYPNLTHQERREVTPYLDQNHRNFQPELLKQEYSSLGTGDFRNPAYQVEQPTGSRITQLQFQKAQVITGKARLTGLPSSFEDGRDDVETLVVTMADDAIGLIVKLNYTVFPHQDVIVRSARFINHGEDTLRLLNAQSSQLDLPDHEYDLIQFSGAWARERHFNRHPLHVGTQRIESLRAASSPQQNPFILLARPQTTEQAGEAISVNLIYSGNFQQSIEVDHYGATRILTGINSTEFAWELTPHTEFQTPEAVISYTPNGLNTMTHQLTEFYAKHLVNPHFATQERPILINNWEATYFNFNEEKLLQFAREAKDLGIELFVLDDGWFGHRNDDTTSLGDWTSDPHKLPQGVGHLAQQIHSLGLQFGLWFEPEMVSLDSELYRTHPDWTIHVPNRHMTPMRNQYVLDMSRQEVVDYLFSAMSTIISDTQLDYIKWDMNRNITEMFSTALTPTQQMELPHRYILGVYQLYQRLIDAFPNVLFESCASGGGRFDLGMMAYAPQAWASDDTDALERLKIQTGTSYGYAISMMGAHVSAVPNYQTGRVTSLTTRANAAYFGDFGYELDITQLSRTELVQIRDQVKFYKHYRRLFQFGQFYRLSDPTDPNVTAWESVSPDQQTAIAVRFQALNQPNPAYLRLRLEGLDPNQTYRVNQSSETFYGDELMNAGLVLDQVLDINEPITESADFSSRLLVVEAAH
ncbi:alpha-galactosidase [Levilactobacillus bambusae]|uniref:Alpha-galactosidase n=1 Tax=Levilactobacillus bambusae TaxID=2024736 RepID=A0A2V1MZH9_9LACO|nr:alpha-galactosidase [Levilactobacillus bambusae]PWG00421.1 alpha-galactosidase [Levilactobacillus bambusae]